MSDPSPAGDRPILEVSDLAVTYGGVVEALRGVSISVAEGSVVALLGSNGAGKTTLLRALSGTLRLHRGRVERGEVLYRGESLKGRDPARCVSSGLVQVPEGRRIFTRLTVEENLRAGGLAVRDRGGLTADYERIYEMFPVLADRRAQRAGLLSGGEQQMLAIGRGLMARPRLLLLDEPSLGLAPRIIGQIGEVIRAINGQGTSVLLVEQNATMALGVADTAFVLDVGAVSLSGPAAELAKSDAVQRLYLGHGADESSVTAGQGVPHQEADEVVAVSVTPEVDVREDVETLTVESVTVAFGAVKALSDVSFTVQPGTVHAVIGPNGAGKSTMFNVLSGVYRATAGEVRLGETVLNGLRPHQIARLGVARAFQNIALSNTQTVAENLMLGRHALTHTGFLAAGLRLPTATREGRRHGARVREIAEFLELGEKLDVPVGVLSYGDQKRVEVARALCTEPRLLLLDEPVAGMNAEETERMAQAVLEIRDALGISIILVEHDMGMVMSIADRVTVLDFGRRIADGSPAETQADPEVIRAYLGSGDEVAPGAAHQHDPEESSP